jgi:hypothetical protein
MVRHCEEACAVRHCEEAAKLLLWLIIISADAAICSQKQEVARCYGAFGNVLPVRADCFTSFAMTAMIERHCEEAAKLLLWLIIISADAAICSQKQEVARCYGDFGNVLPVRADCLPCRQAGFTLFAMTAMIERHHVEVKKT